MRHEAIDRGVRQDQHLRCPPPDDHAKAGDACLELVQEPCTLAEYFFFSFTLYSFLHRNFKPWEELARRVSVELRVLHHPDERMGRRLEAEPELDELLRIRARDATEGRS